MSSPEPINKKLYAEIKQVADEKYKTHGAYKSAWIVKKYKELGGKYKGKKDQLLKLILKIMFLI